MTDNSKPFWCFGWHQQIFPYLCIHRYKKGMKKCEHCKKGKELIEQELALIKINESSAIENCQSKIEN